MVAAAIRAPSRALRNSRSSPSRSSAGREQSKEGRVLVWSFFFFFQAEDGIRDKLVTGVQTCALPISPALIRGVITSAAMSGLNSFATVLSRTIGARAHLDRPTIAEVAPLPARHERGWGEGLVPSNCRALLKSPLPDPLPTSPSWGEGIDRGLGGGIKMRPRR